jgi:hypothetical protein
MLRVKVTFLGGRPDVSRAIREIINEKMSVQQSAEGEKTSKSVQPCESGLIKKTFRLLNRGEPVWKAAQETGDIRIVDECYRKRKEWMRMEQAEDFEKHRLIVESECWRLLYHISTWKGYVSPKILGYLVGVVNACMIKLILPSEVIEKTFNVSLDEFISKVNREVEKRKSNPLYNLDSVTRYIMVRELLDEWRERRKERLAKMNPHPSTIEQIGSGRGCRNGRC